MATGLLLPILLTAQNYAFGPSVRVNTDSPGVTWHQTYSPGQHLIACRGDTVYLVWRGDQGGESHIYFARSNDGGQSFLPEVRADNTPPGCVGIFPSLAVDDSGVIHVSWLNYNASPLNHAFTHYSKSTDGGLNFRPSIRACDSVSPHQYAFPSIAVSKDGRRVYVVRSEAGYEMSHPYWVILSRSTDGGASFVSPNTVVYSPDSTTWITNPSVAVLFDTVVLVACDSHTPPNTRLAVIFAKSTDGGVSFRNPVGISDSIVGGVHPSIAVDTLGTVYVVWGYGYYGVGITASCNGGDTFPYPGTVPSSFGGNYPSLWASQMGQLYLSWVVDIGGQTGIVFCYSPDGGMTFLPRVYPSSLPGPDDDMPTVTANDQGRVFLAWSDGLMGTWYDIYCASGELSAIQETQLPKPPGLTCDVFPNPARCPLRIAYSLRGGGHVKVEVVDPAGRRVALLSDGYESQGQHLKTWPGLDSRGRRVLAGIYFVRLATPDGSVCRKVLVMSE
jgi:hypothetical protein